MTAAPVSALLLHGLCSTPDELLPVQGALQRAGHTVRALRVPGYSYAGAGAPATTFTRWLRTVADAVREQRAEGRRVLLAGLSAGAALALGTALQRGAAPDALVLMSTTLQYDGWGVPPWQALLPLALYTPLGRFWQYRERPPYGVKNPRVREWVRRELSTRSISSAGAAVIGVPHLREHDRLRRLVLRRMGSVDCPPVLALHAVDDEVASPRNLALLRARLRTPAFRAVLLRDSHHMITIDNDRQQVAREIVAFADGLAAAPTPAFPFRRHPGVRP